MNTIEDVDLADSTYDITYFNGNSSYIADSKPVYGKCKHAPKEGGNPILLVVPKESAFGFVSPSYYQTLTRNLLYTGEGPKEVLEGCGHRRRTNCL